MTSSESVLACVVTFNPGADLAANLCALRSQVPYAVVIDNGSVEAPTVRRLAEAAGCEFIGNRENKGMAAALNQGLDAARKHKVEWLAAFDQDSLLPEGAIGRMLAFCRAHPDSTSIGVLTPTHEDRVTRRHYHHALDILQETPRWRRLRSTITSGSLFRMQAVAQAGRFDEDLFIDSVDHDYCLRLRRHGWLVIEDREQVMEHSVGAATQHRFLWTTRVCSNHSPVRRYYMARNQLEVARRHLMADPVWSVKCCLQLVSAAAGVALFENERGAKLRAMAQGIVHFLARRFGPRP